MNDVIPDNYYVDINVGIHNDSILPSDNHVDHNAGMHDDAILPVDNNVDHNAGIHDDAILPVDNHVDHNPGMHDDVMLPVNNNAVLNPGMHDDAMLPADNHVNHNAGMHDDAILNVDNHINHNAGMHDDDILPVDNHVDHNAGMRDDAILPVDNHVDLNAGMHDDAILPVDNHVDLNAGMHDDANFDGKKVKHTWDLPTIINVNARSLNAEKVDELQVIVDDYDIDVACITETWFREYMDDSSLALDGFCLERKDRDHRRGGGVACYIRNDIEYKRLRELEDDMLEVLWIKVMPKRLPRKYSCILVGCLYYTHQTDFLEMREHVITAIDTITRKHPDCGVVLLGDFNQFNDKFLISHYRFIQMVNISTRGDAILDKIWTNMAELFNQAVSISELGKSDHNMILLQPMVQKRHDTGRVTRVTIKSMGANEKAHFSKALTSVRWEPLFLLHTCEEKYNYYKDVVISLMDTFFTNKVVTRHTADKPWVTDYFRCLIRKRQRAFMRGDTCEYNALRNETNRAAARLKFEFYQKHILSITESGTRDWWKNMKKIMGLDGNSN